MTKRCVCVVQARMTSSRFPGKVLKQFAGRTVLEHVLTKCTKIPGIDAVVCATVTDDSAIPIIKEATAHGALIFRGSTEDVLDRYLGTAIMAKADVVMRITSDCPLTDSVLDGRVLQLLIDANADYACNNMPRLYPHGLDCEAFTLDALKRAHDLATKPEEREHVTPWLRTNSTIKRVVLPGPEPEENFKGWRWTLDYSEDLLFLQRLFELLPSPATPPADWRSLVRIIREHPELMLINRHRH